VLALIVISLATAAVPPPPIPGLTLPDANPCISTEPLLQAEHEDGVAIATTQGLDSRQIKSALGPFYAHLDACGRKAEVVPVAEEIMEITVGCDGRVTDVYAMGTSDWPHPVTSCVTDALYYAGFPAHALPDGSTFLIPIRFRNAGTRSEKTEQARPSLASAWAQQEAEKVRAESRTSPRPRPTSEVQRAIASTKLSTAPPPDVPTVAAVTLPDTSALTRPRPALPTPPARPTPRPAVVAVPVPAPRVRPAPVPPTQTTATKTTATNDAIAAADLSVSRSLSEAEACESGNGRACYQIAKMEAIDRNRGKRAARLTLKRGCDARLSDPSACFLLGIYQERGLGGDKDRTVATRTFKRGCDLGNAQSCDRRGELLHAGVGVRRNDEGALAALTTGCDLGLPSSCVTAGSILNEGTFIHRDIEGAVGFFQQGCDGEDAVGCTQLGLLREEQGEQESARQALILGTALGSPLAMRHLARFLHNGLGGKKEKGKAKELCMEACAAGETKACQGAQYL
jgi:TPR repeat protein